MSKVVSPTECADFQAHQWKKDMCVNCSRGRAMHSKMQNPVARRPKPRTLTTTATKGTTSPPKPEVTKPATKLGNAHEMKLAFLADTSPTKSPTTKLENKTNARQAAPRSTVTTQPTYANAQEVSKINNGEKKKIETTVTKSPAIHNTGRSISVDSSPTKPNKLSADLSRSQSTKEDVAVRGDSTKRNRKHRMSRPAGPPPQAPKSPDFTTSVTSASTDSIHLDQIPAQVLEDIQKQLAEGDKGSGGSHYYHKYDVSASMRRRAKQQQQQQPAIVDIETRLATASPLERAALVAKIKATLGESAAQDVLPNDIMPDQIAMPYNIVDVSAQLPRDDRPPRLPSSPAPSKEDSLNRASLHNKKKNAAKKEENGNEPRTIVLKENEPQSPHKVPILIQSQLNGHHIQHTYEPINDPNGNNTEDDIPFADAHTTKGFVRASPVRSTAPVRGPLASSWKAEQKAQSLDHLDLSHTPASQGSPTKASPERTESAEVTEEPVPAARKTANKAKEKAKKEKANGNSGGFFKKLFGFGRRDSDIGSEDEKKPSVQEKEPSSGSVEEDPLSAATSTMASTAPSTDDLSSSVSNIQSAEIEDSPPPSISPLSLSPIIRESSPRKLNLTLETNTSSKDESKGSDRVNNFVSFSDEIGDILGEKLSVNLNFTEDKKEKEQEAEGATLIGATSLTDEIMDMLSSFGGDSKGGQKSPNPIPASRSQPKPSTKPSIPLTKPTQRPRGAKPTSPSIKPPSPPVPKPRPSSDKLGELTIEIEHVAGKSSAKSPQVSFDIGGTSSPPVRQSASQSSLLSDGSGSSSGRTGTSEDTSTLTRKPRPRSTAVSRKMLNAPPPPPPGIDKQRSQSSSGPVSPISPKPANSGGSSPIKIGPLPKISPKLKDGSNQPQSPRHLEISAPIAVTTTLNTAQTLPRPIKHRASPEADPMQKSVDDLTEYKKKKRGDSVAKHARNKTVTEGIAFDIDALNGEEDDRITQLLENSKEKFVNRALPAPPSAPPPAPPTTGKHHIPLEDGNYEFVNTVEGPTLGGGGHVPGNYEDIDSLYSAIPADMVCEEYLQPVNNTEPPVESKPKTKPKVKWTPKAAKRLSEWAGKKFPQPMTESYVMVYANTEILLDKDRPALTISEGFEKMSVMNQQTLHNIAENIFRAHCPQNPHFSDELHFEDFGIGDREPVLTQGCVCMYRARQAVVQPFNGFLMLSAKSLHRGFLDQQSCHLVSPSVLISDRISAEYFPDPNNTSDPDHYQLYGQVQTNMAVLHYNTLVPLTNYIAELAQRTATRSAAEEYERQVCYCLAQIFSAVLDSYSNGPQSVYAVKTLGIKDIAVVTLGKSEEKFLVTNAASQNHSDEVNYETLGMDILTILGHFLHLDVNRKITEHSIIEKSRYSKGLRQFVRIISECRFESLIQGKNLLEYLLWGPCVEDHDVLMANSDTIQAFGVWLEVARCKAVTDSAIGQLAKTVYTANRLQFLCCVTGVSLSETAALLKE